MNQSRLSFGQLLVCQQIVKSLGRYVCFGVSFLRMYIRIIVQITVVILYQSKLQVTILNCKLSLDLQNYVRPSVRTTISPAVFIGFFQYRTQGIITMSRASWMKLFFFRVMFQVIFGPLKKA